MNKQPNSEMCFICGRGNPVGLYMQFYDDGDCQVFSDYTVPAHYQGYPGIVHGGVLAAMLDEVVGRVAMIGDHHHFMMSVRLEVLYRYPVPVETPLRVAGRIVRLRGRLGKAEGSITLPDGTRACESSMTLADVPAELLASAPAGLLNWRLD
jgi:acyl-coenzyme A thioesterase PaaI-like protein